MNLISHLPSLWCHRLSSHCPNLVHTDRGQLWISPTMESHGSDKEKDSVVGWHHTHFVKREPWRILPRVGEGLVLRRCLYPTKSAPTHWFPSVSHSHGANLKPMPRPTVASLSLPGQRAHSWTKRCSHRSLFLPAVFTLETLMNVTQAKQREFMRFWGWHIPLFPAVYWQINSNAFKLHHEV